MRRDLGVEDLGDLLELPLLAVLATYRRDGTVLLSPVWHEWRDSGFSVVTSSDGLKVRHLRRNPAASLVVCEATPPYRGIEVRCTVRFVTVGVQEAARRIAVRYLGAEAGAAYAAAIADDLVLRLDPEAIRAWDFADELAG
jgi:PPOX class probable F420-dependent enzyme